MPKRNDQIPPVDAIERDYIDALGRLQGGKPENSELRKLLKKGLLKINISNVAKEAGRSRTLLATDGGKYARVRQLVLLSKKGLHTCETRTASQTITRLRENVATLQAQLDASSELNLSYLERMRTAQKREVRLRAALDRLRSKRRAAAGNVVQL